MYFWFVSMVDWWWFLCPWTKVLAVLIWKGNFSNLQAGYVGEDVESILYKLLAVGNLFCISMMLFEQIINSLNKVKWTSFSCSLKISTFCPKFTLAYITLFPHLFKKCTMLPIFFFSGLVYVPMFPWFWCLSLFLVDNLLVDVKKLVIVWLKLLISCGKGLSMVFLCCFTDALSIHFFSYNYCFCFNLCDCLNTSVIKLYL